MQSAMHPQQAVYTMPCQSMPNYYQPTPPVPIQQTAAHTMPCQTMPNYHQTTPPVLNQQPAVHTMSCQSMPNYYQPTPPGPIPQPAVHAMPCQSMPNYYQPTPLVSIPQPPVYTMPPQSMPNYYQSTPLVSIPQPMSSPLNYQQFQQVMSYQTMQPRVNASQTVPSSMICTPSPQMKDFQPMQVPKNPYLVTGNCQPQVQPMSYSQLVQPRMNNSVDYQHQRFLNFCCVNAVSKNFLLKFNLSSFQLKHLKNGQSCEISSGAPNNHFFLEINSDCHLSFKLSDKWESLDIVYAYVETEERVFSLEESPKLLFLDPFDPSCINDEDVTIHCMVIAYPSCSTTDQYQGTGTAELRTVPTVTSSDGVLPFSYKNEKVINFIRKGIIPNLNVDVAIEIISDSKVHNCKVLSILCTEYLMKNFTSENLKKIVKVATDNRLQVLHEKIVQEMEKFEIKLKEDKTEKCEFIQKENDAEKCEKVEEDSKTKENKTRKNEAQKKRKE